MSALASRLPARLGSLALGALPILAILVAWEATARLGLVAPGLLPRPGAVLARVAAALVDPGFLADAAVTAWRLFAGFCLAALIGIGLGLLAAASRVFAAGLTPLVRILAPVPKIALYPALVLLFGFDSVSKILLVVADAVFPILLATLAGARAVEPKLVWSARAAGASRVSTLFTVVLPAAAPSILTGCRVALVIACIVVFLAEMIAATNGLGTVLVRAARTFQTAEMFVPLIAISGLGLILNALFEALRARLLRGFPETDAER